MAGGWEAGSGHVVWCEGVTHLHRFSPLIAEMFNTISNIATLMAAGYGLTRARRKRLPRAFGFSDLCLLSVGLGSMVFHATRSFYGEMMDELPMSAMAFGYMWCLKGTHKYTSGRTWSLVLAVYSLVVAIAWGSYLFYGWYDVFTTSFTAQEVGRTCICGGQVYP
ncbi:hypothetical protein GUITHDRAFT_143177 [Guillardia theta CCMP2712]|uniref:Post-GPI attachment to proteins factor 3 n=1 Tax=Guillardia theta (strain CCMP2712) TaxID=905079 RepID=L1IU70_GUITC|nr:hypothetical protein GUITHDRAFT_143177 [Guillardia theta CCMP2712]EKX39781.1 hypothetical protein GUITHDRAFT_143177 [Guillardia theta CCMP2712]|eukprot:XP_005826761.1 hypothetical protein GUITHDRAFT_143177 [Guillardia theta CCMP2712]